jgi:hypothetical protein
MQTSTPRHRRPSFWFGWILLISGGFLLICLLLDLRLALFGKTTEGIVTRIEEKTSSSHTTRRSNESVSEYRRRSANTTGGISYYPWVRYQPAEGASVEFKTLSTFGHDVTVGTAVKVIYLASNPQKAQIFQFKQVWAPIIIGSIFTTGCIILGFILLRISTRPVRLRN